MSDKSETPNVVAYEVASLPLSDIKPAEYNPRKIKPHKFRALKKSIEDNGLLQPIVINKHTGNRVVSGHQRLRAVTELEWDEVPVHIIDVDEPTEKLLNLSSNNAGGETDSVKLVPVLMDLTNLGIDMSSTGFQADEIAGYLGKKEEDEDPEYPITPYMSEKYNYVVIFTKNEVDWTYLKNALELETMQSYKSSAVGLSHVVDFEKFEQLWKHRT